MGNFPVQLAPPIKVLVSGFFGASSAGGSTGTLAFPFDLELSAGSGAGIAGAGFFRGFFPSPKMMLKPSSAGGGAAAGFFEPPRGG